MEYVRLGLSGLKAPRICLGMMSYGDPAAQEWALGPDAAEPIVRQAVEGGITFFDTADMYSGGVSEEITGRLLAKFFPRRDDYLLATIEFRDVFQIRLGAAGLRANIFRELVSAI
jgi:1-deoxyxylulose-5-phosphate synthase